MKILKFIKAFILITLLLLSSLLFNYTLFSSTAHAITTQEKQEKEVWDIIDAVSPSQQITAAICAVIRYESNYKSDSVCGSWVYSSDISASITAEIDKGLADGSNREEFIRGDYCFGYGFCQWVDPHEVTSLYDFAREYGSSIGDAHMQAEFIMWDLENNYPELWAEMVSLSDESYITLRFCIYYMGTNNPDKVGTRRYYATKLLEEYGTMGDEEDIDLHRPESDLEDDGK